MITYNITTSIDFFFRKTTMRIKKKTIKKMLIQNTNNFVKPLSVFTYKKYLVPKLVPKLPKSPQRSAINVRDCDDTTLIFRYERFKTFD